MAPERPLAPVQNRRIRPRYEDFSGWGPYFVRDIAGNQLNPYQAAGTRAKRSAPVGAGPIRPGGDGLWGPGGVWGGGGPGRRVPTWFGGLGGPKTEGGTSSKRSARNSPLTRGTPFALGDFWPPNRGEKCVSSREHDGSRRDLKYVRCLGAEDLNRQERVDLTEEEKSYKDLAVSALNSFEN
jgi:hypothetical protein